MNTKLCLITGSILAALLLGLTGCLTISTQPSSTGQSAATVPTAPTVPTLPNIPLPNNGVHPAPATLQYVCDLEGSKAAALGIKGTDLGIPVSLPSLKSWWFLFGDVNGQKTAEGGSAVLQAEAPFDCSKTFWKTYPDGKYYQPLTSKRQPGDESTVPAGAIEVNGTLYIYAMRVDHWGGPDATDAHGVLFKNQNGKFIEVFSWPVNEKHVNTSPVMGELNGQQVIFMAITGKYRTSPVYLAYVNPGEIENQNAYRYLVGLDANNAPIWSENINNAKPLSGMEDVEAGEISLVRNYKLGEYYLMFKNYQDNNSSFMLFSADNPYGPYSAPTRFYPCDTSASWMQPGWGTCYGGYIMPDNFGSNGKEIYFTVSLWKPYTVVLLKMELE